MESEIDKPSVAEYSSDELRDALGPIASLISKSAKAQQKVAPGTWQHAMLRDNVEALKIASCLIAKDIHSLAGYTREDMEKGLRALVSLETKTETAQSKFAPGTSQHTLLRNRLAALRVAEAHVRIALERMIA